MSYKSNIQDMLGRQGFASIVFWVQKSPSYRKEGRCWGATAVKNGNPCELFSKNTMTECLRGIDVVQAGDTVWQVTPKVLPVVNNGRRNTGNGLCMCTCGTYLEDVCLIHNPNEIDRRLAIVFASLPLSNITALMAHVGTIRADALPKTHPKHDPEDWEEVPWLRKEA